MTQRILAIAFSFLAASSLAAGARADCPHARPVSGAACVDPGFAACTYTDAGVTIACSCRDGRWACEPMIAAQS